MSVSYCYDGSFDGFLTCVFEAYERKETPENISEAGFAQEALGCQTIEIRTDEAKARRVEAGIIKRSGSPCYQKIWTCFLSCDLDKASLLYRYIRRCFEIGRSIYDNITHEDVLHVENMYLSVGREAHLLKEFVRFSDIGGNVYFSKITPKNSIVPLLMPHFSDRMSIQPFLIYDAAHFIAGVYNLKEWYLVETDLLQIPKPAEDEILFRAMWKDFYDTIAIRERLNPICRRNHMPMRYWANMTEHNFLAPENRNKASAFTLMLEPEKIMPDTVY